MARDQDELKRALSFAIAWRDFLAKELARTDTLIARDSRALADALGLKVRPTLPQLRRQLMPVDKRGNDPLGTESAVANPARP
jgi:hypothetical protein